MPFFFSPFKSFLFFIYVFLFLPCYAFQKTNFSPEKFQILNKKALDIQSDSAYLKAEMAYFEGRNQLALKFFKEALLMHSQSAYLYKRIASLYEKEGLSSSAMAYYKKLQKNRKLNQELRQKMTALYQSKGLYKKALDIQKKTSKLYPHNFSVWFKLAFLLDQQHQYKKALSAISQAEKLAVTSKQKDQISLSKAYLFAKLKNQSQSLNLINRLEKRESPTEELILKLSQFYKFLGQKQSSVRYLEKIQKKNDSPLISEILLEHYLHQSNWKQALKQIQSLQKFGKLKKEHYFYMSLFYLEQKKYDKAVSALKDLLMKAPGQGQYLYLLALAYEKQKQWVPAMETYNQVKSSSPHFLISRLQMAQIWSQIGNKKKSIEILNKLSFPKEGNIEVQALLIYAESLWNSKQKKKALQVLTKAKKNLPLNEDILFLRALYLKNTGQYDLALKDIQQILKETKDHQEAMNFLATLYSEQNMNIKEAEKLARKALAIEPNSIAFLNTLGWILFQNGNPKSALNYLNQAYQKQKSSFLAKRLGTVHLALKNLKKSDYFFKKAKQLQDEKKNKPPHKSASYKPAFLP